jgi:hypothetical protein
MFDAPKVAISASLLGTVAGLQFSGVFHRELVGFWFHVALPALTSEQQTTVKAKSRKETILFIGIGPSGGYLRWRSR